MDGMFEPKDRNIPYWEDVERLQQIDDYVKKQWDNGQRQAICCVYDCHTRDFWKHFDSTKWRRHTTKKVRLDHEEVHGEGDHKWVNVRTCWNCVMIREDLENEAAARLWIVQHQAFYQRHKSDRQNFEAAQKHRLEFFNMMKGKQRHKSTKIFRCAQQQALVLATGGQRGDSKLVLGAWARWRSRVSRPQTKEPAPSTVKNYVRDRRIMDRVERAEHTMFLAESWPKLLLRIRELEDKRAQAADKKGAAEEGASQRRRKRERALEPAVLTASDVHSDVNSV